NHLLFVEGDVYATTFGMFEPFSDPNIAFSFHYYPFLHQHKSNKPTQAERIRDSFAEQVDLDDLHGRLGRPVWCGETGALLGAPDRSVQESMLKDTLDFFEENRVSWSIWAYKDARSMGTVHPKADSGWMDFSTKARRGWNFWDDFTARETTVDAILAQYPTAITDRERLKVGFRVMADYQLVLAAGYPELLTTVPFATLLEAARSFRFENCEVWRTVADMVRNLTRS
ncbi:MAG TPA: hypothetical protein ENN69_09285, partial [Spirochaetia bacterium]|nr:hypothetical protein [Spirochaetia bacterium]